MTDTVHFLGMERVLVIHKRMMDEYGGGAGVRDQGLLESACAMPEATFGGEFLHDGIPAMAAAYLFHICKNHPFLDGNKRTALAAAVMFLFINGYALNAPKDEVERLTIGVADGSVSKSDSTDYFKKHVKIDQPQTNGRSRKPRQKKRKK